MLSNHILIGFPRLAYSHDFLVFSIILAPYSVVQNSPERRCCCIRESAHTTVAFLFFVVYRIGRCGPLVSYIVCHTHLFVLCSLRDIFKIRRRHFTSNDCSLCSLPASKHSSQNRRSVNHCTMFLDTLIFDAAEMSLVFGPELPR